MGLAAIVPQAGGEVAEAVPSQLFPALVERDRNFNRGGSAIRRVYDAITARARTDRRAAACPPPRARASRAVGTAGTVGGMPAGTNLPRRWGRPPTPKVPAGGGASGLGSGDRRGVGGRAWGA